MTTETHHAWFRWKEDGTDDMIDSKITDLYGEYDENLISWDLTGIKDADNKMWMRLTWVVKTEKKDKDNIY